MLKQLEAIRKQLEAAKSMSEATSRRLDFLENRQDKAHGLLHSDGKLRTEHMLGTLRLQPEVLSSDSLILACQIESNNIEDDVEPVIGDGCVESGFLVSSNVLNCGLDGCAQTVCENASNTIDSYSPIHSEDNVVDQRCEVRGLEDTFWGSDHKWSLCTQGVCENASKVLCSGDSCVSDDQFKLPSPRQLFYLPPIKPPDELLSFMKVMDQKLTRKSCVNMRLTQTIMAADVMKLGLLKLRFEMVRIVKVLNQPLLVAHVNHIFNGYCKQLWDPYIMACEYIWYLSERWDVVLSSIQKVESMFKLLTGECWKAHTSLYLIRGTHITKLHFTRYRKGRVVFCWTFLMKPIGNWIAYMTSYMTNMCNLKAKDAATEDENHSYKMMLDNDYIEEEKAGDGDCIRPEVNGYKLDSLLMVGQTWDINVFTIFSSPRPPEIANLEDKVFRSGEECYIPYNEGTLGTNV